MCIRDRDKAEWLKAVKLHAFLLKRQREKEGRNRVRREEKFYRKNFYRFAKEVCEGTLFERRCSQASRKRRRMRISVRNMAAQ